MACGLVVVVDVDTGTRMWGRGRRRAFGMLVAGFGVVVDFGGVGSWRGRRIGVVGGGSGREGGMARLLTYRKTSE